MLLDTSGLLSCLDRRDARHHDASALVRAADVRVTHNYVLAELVALTRARNLDRQQCLRFIEDLMQNQDVGLVWVDRKLHERAMRLLAAQLDKQYSLCDAVSFTVMRERGLAVALTTDRHFEQAGFLRLLPE